MKRLNGKDLIKAARLVKHLEVTDEIMNIAKGMADGSIHKTQDQLGATLLFTIIGNISSEQAERCLWDFLSGPFEMEADAVAEMELMDIAKSIEELIKLEEPEAWRSFFRQLAGLVKKN